MNKNLKQLTLKNNSSRGHDYLVQNRSELSLGLFEADYQLSEALNPPFS
jgi:hypothetical protein